MLTCNFCPDPYCKKENAKYPPGCPCLDTASVDGSKARSIDPKYLEIGVQSALLEANHGWDKTRLEETLRFIKTMGYKRIGVAFCYGLRNEARVLCDILSKYGLEVVSTSCKFGNVPKEHIGLHGEQKFLPDEYDPMCNPIGQALFLDSNETEFNILLGLCVGHDTLFIKTSETPLTVFAVKDRILCHNPLGAIYTIGNFYKNLADPGFLK